MVSLRLRGLVIKLCQSHLTGVWQTQQSITLKVLAAAWGGLVRAFCELVIKGDSERQKSLILLSPS